MQRNRGRGGKGSRGASAAARSTPRPKTEPIIENVVEDDSSDDENASADASDASSDHEVDSDSKIESDDEEDSDEGDDEEEDMMEADVGAVTPQHEQSAAVSAFFSTEFGHTLSQHIIKVDADMRAVIEGIVDTLAGANTAPTSVAVFGALFQAATHVIQSLLTSAKARSEAAEQLRTKSASSMQESVASVPTKEIARAAARRNDPEAKAIQEGNRMLARLSAILTLMQSLCGHPLLLGAVPDPVIRQTSNLVSNQIVSVLLRDTTGTVATKIALPSLKLAERYLAVLVSAPFNSIALWKKSKSADGAVGQELLTSVLAQVISGKPASRKTALEVLTHLLSLDSSTHVDSSIARFLVAIFGSPATTTSAQQKLVLGLKLARSTLPLFQSQAPRDSVVQSLVKLMGSSVSTPIVSASVFAVFQALVVQSRSLEVAASVFQILIDRRPASSSAKDSISACCSWTSAMCAVELVILSNDAQQAVLRLPHILDAVLALLQSEAVAVSSSAAALFQRLAVSFLGGSPKDVSLSRFLKLKPELVGLEEDVQRAQSAQFSDALQSGAQHPFFAMIDCFVTHFQSSLKFSFQNAWDNVCRVVTAAMNCVARNVALHLRAHPASHVTVFEFICSKVKELLSNLIAVRHAQREKLMETQRKEDDRRNRKRRAPTQKLEAEPAMAAVMRAMGFRFFFSSVGLCLPAVPQETQIFMSAAQRESTRVVSEANLWLLPFVNQHGLGDTGCLKDFTDTLIPIAQRLHEASVSHTTDDTVSRKLQTLSEQVWATFPAVAKGAFDIADMFATLAQIIGPQLLDASVSWEIRHSMIHGLSGLISHVKSDLSADVISAAARERLVAAMHAIGSSSNDFLQCLFSLYLTPPTESSTEDSLNRVRRVVFVSIDLFLHAAASDKSTAGTITTMFKRIMAKLLSGDSSTPAMTGALIDLSLAFVPHLDAKTLSLLYRALEPYMNGQLPDARITGLETKSFKVLVQMCQKRATDFLAVHVEPIVKVMLHHIQSLGANAVLAPAHFAIMGSLAQHMPLEQLSLWLQGTSPFTPSPLPSVLLGFRHSKSRARDASRDIISKIGSRLVTEQGASGLRMLVSLFFVGLAGRSSHFQAASLAVLTHIIHEFDHQIVDAEIQSVSAQEAPMLAQLVKTSTLLLEWQTADVRQAAIRLLLSLVKPTYAVSVKEHNLRPPYLEIWSAAASMCLKAPDFVKAKLRSDIKAVLERIIKKWGIEVVQSICPVSQRKLVSNIRKNLVRSRRAKQNSASKKGDKQDKKGNKQDKKDTKGSKKKKEKRGAFQDDEASSDSDSGDDGFADGLFDDNSRSKTKNIVMADDDDDNPVDFTGSAKPVMKQDRTRAPRIPVLLDGDGDIRMSEDGLLMIGDTESSAPAAVADDEGPVRPKRKRRDDDDDDSGDDTRGGKAGAKSKSAEKRTKVSDSKFGNDYYKASTGQSDIKRKGSKYEPFAYLPLNPKFLNKRRRLHAHKQYDAVAGTGHRRKQQK
jgi:hypothetical protein